MWASGQWLRRKTLAHNELTSLHPQVVSDAEGARHTHWLYTHTHTQPQTQTQTQTVFALSSRHTWIRLRFYELMQCHRCFCRCFILPSECRLGRENLSWLSSQDTLIQCVSALRSDVRTMPLINQLHRKPENEILGHIVEIKHLICLLPSSLSSTLPSASSPSCCYLVDLELWAGYSSPNIPGGRLLHVHTVRLILTAHLWLRKI